MNLALEVARPNGRKTKDLFPAIQGELSADDLGLLSAERGVQKPPDAVKRLSERHKNLARLLANGVEAWEAALITGYSESHISILKGDPAFRDLLRLYGEARDLAFQSVQDKMIGLSHDMLDVIQDKIENEPEKITLAQSLEIFKTVADRSGNGPQTKSTNVNVNVDIASRMETARHRLNAMRKATDITVIEND